MCVQVPDLHHKGVQPMILQPTSFPSIAPLPDLLHLWLLSHSNCHHQLWKEFISRLTEQPAPNKVMGAHHQQCHGQNYREVTHLAVNDEARQHDDMRRGLAQACAHRIRECFLQCQHTCSCLLHRAHCGEEELEFWNILQPTSEGQDAQGSSWTQHKHLCLLWPK